MVSRVCVQLDPHLSLVVHLDSLFAFATGREEECSSWGRSEKSYFLLGTEGRLRKSH